MTQLVLKSGNPKEVFSLINDALGNEKKIISASIRGTERILSDFENRYKMSSREFFEKYQMGEMGDAPEMIDWAGVWDYRGQTLKM